MAAIESTRRRARRIVLPHHPDVAVAIRLAIFDPSNTAHPRELRVRYTGPAEELVAAGVATPAMLTRAPARRSHLARVDSDGHRFQVTRHVGSRGGRSYTRFTVTREKPAEVALAMPGVRKAWEQVPVDEWRTEHAWQLEEPMSEPEPILAEDPETMLSRVRTAAEWKLMFEGWLVSHVGYITGTARRLATDGRFRLLEEDAMQLQRVLLDGLHDELRRVLNAAMVLDTQAAPQPVPEAMTTRAVH
jgi:hypothetical protein